MLWNVPPLEVPGSAHLQPGRAAEDVLAGVREFSAVRLFVARAVAAAPGFALDADNVPAVAAICRRLDGIPLALELAATLRAMIDWSWELLSEAERIVLRRLAIHTEGCTLDAAETVCAGDGVRPADVLDLLARLVDRSLVVSHVQGTAQPRYRLLESVTAYCLGRVREAGEIERLRQRHGHYYIALDTVTQHGDADLALRLVNAMTWYWFLRGRLSEARRSLRMALSVRGDTSAAARANAVAWKARAARLLGAAAETRESVGAPLPSGERRDVDRITATARKALGEQVFAAEFERGATLEPDELARLPVEAT